MIHTTIDILGALTLGIIAGFLGLLLYHILLAFVKAWSWHRWALKISSKYDREVKWMKLPKGFLTIWLHMLGDSSSTWSNDGGKWEGIGKWVIYPKNEVKNMWEEE